MSFNRYPEYKDSGVEWLGDVPDHWTLTRLKRACNVFPSNIDKKSYDHELAVLLCNYTDVYYNDQIVDGMTFMAATASSEQIERFSLRAGDTIITKDSETADDIAISTYVPRDLPGVVCGYHLSVVRAKGGVQGSFVKRFFDSIYAKSCFAVRANGLTRVGLSQYVLDNIELALPPIKEQQAISTFLDREIAKIDALIAEQQKLVALLKEKRQAVISNAVTKGLDPTVAMKESGVEWLGDVPVHWTVSGLKNIVSTPITDGPHETPNFPDEGIPFVSAEAVSSGTIDFAKIRGFISEEDHLRYSRKYRPQIGDIYMVKSGATTGITAIVETDQEFNIWSPLAAIRCSSIVLPYFVLNFLRSKNFQEAIALNWNFGTQQNIGMGVIENLAVPIPPITEQRFIVGRLNQLTKQLDDLVVEARKATTLLEERRTALISAAVTGKIDASATIALSETVV